MSKDTLIQKYRRSSNEIYSSESEEELNIKDIPPHFLNPESQ